MDICQFSIHHDDVENTLLTSMQHMNMYWFVFVGVEVKDETEVLEYLWHFMFIVSVCKDTIYFAKKYVLVIKTN